jgi:hypothetical protein
MAVIKVPKPPRSAYDPNRPVSGLLKMQMEHFHLAERKLPARYQSGIYVNAVKTEGEAANYIRAATEAIHAAHADAAAARAKAATRRKRVIEIAAAADERPGKRTQTKKKTKRIAKKAVRRRD